MLGYDLCCDVEVCETELITHVGIKVFELRSTNLACFHYLSIIRVRYITDNTFNSFLSVIVSF